MRIDSTIYSACHSFQTEWCFHLGGPILNACCQADPNHLGEKFNVTNVDVCDLEVHNGYIYKDTVKNFLRCDVRKMPFKDGEFKTSILGETIEHCTVEYAYELMQEVVRVTSDYIIITYPYDDRPKHEQHAPEHLIEYAPGSVSWHQTLWSREMLLNMFNEFQLRVIVVKDLVYYFTRPIPGIGMVLKKGVWT